MKFGVAFIEKVPVNMQITEIAIRRLFDIQKTAFGEMWSAVQNPDDRLLEAHTANAFFTDAAGLQVLHCVHRTGESGNYFLVDGFKVLSDLKAKYALTYDRLCRALVPYVYEDGGKRYTHCSPIIKLNAVTRRPEQIRFFFRERMS